MRLLKYSVLSALFACMGVTAIHAKEDNAIVTLPTIQVMAESELREEVGFIPFQEDKKVKQALQHHIYKIENDIQNKGANDSPSVAMDYQPTTVVPDMKQQFSPAIEQYILAVAEGLQSPDPTNGVFKMLEPLGIDRDKALDGVRNGLLNIDQGQLMILQQQLQNGIKGLK